MTLPPASARLGFDILLTWLIRRKIKTGIKAKERVKMRIKATNRYVFLSYSNQHSSIYIYI
jgi:hypothetical protein